jgi:hypothetical protein
MKSVQYLFQTNEFAVSEQGIHLLRSGFNYQTIDWSCIEEIEMSRGKEHHNWFGTFTFGMVIFIAGIYMAFIISETLFYEEISNAYKMMIFFFIPCFGAYIVYSSMQTGIILKLTERTGKRYKLPLKEIVKARKLREFELLLKERCNLTVDSPLTQPNSRVKHDLKRSRI